MCSMYPTALIFCFTDSLDMILHSKNLFGGKNCFSKVLEAFKTQKSPSKVEKCQNILHLTELENVKKCIGVTFQRCKYLLCVLRLCFFVVQTLCISYYIPKTYLGCKYCFKKILEALKLKSHLQKLGQNIKQLQNITILFDF